MQVNVIHALKPEKWHNMQYKSIIYIKSKKSSKYALCMNLLPKSPKYANMHGKVWLFGIVKSQNEYLQSLRSVTSLYKNMHLHGNPGSNYDHCSLMATIEISNLWLIYSYRCLIGFTVLCNMNSFRDTNKRREGTVLYPM